MHRVRTTETVRIRAGDVELEAATAFGPRIVRFAPLGGPNLLAELGDLGIGLPDGRHFSFRGGHRLWLAPEVPEVTYEPDDEPVRIEVEDEVTRVTGTALGVEKTIQLTPLGGSSVAVQHLIVNRTARPRDLAPWAITQLRPGGTALMPITNDPKDAHGLQATTAVVGWSYTDWGSLSLDEANGVLHIDGTRTSPTKVGTALDRGWMAYVVAGWMFVKQARVASTSPVDMGATGQVYACADFVELETLGLPTIAAPGQAVSHREVWHLCRVPDSLPEAAVLAESTASAGVGEPR